MDDAYWFLPLTVTGIAASTTAHLVTMEGLVQRSAIEGNPFAIFLGMGMTGVLLATGAIGGAYLLTWVVCHRPGRTHFDVLVFHLAVVGMTAFFLLDMVNDTVVVL
jgi:hypothetical protein